MKARRPLPDGQVRVVPSLLAADPGALRASLSRVASAGWCSLDVMDGRFVPNLSYGPDVLRALDGCGARIDAHLMVEDPETYGPVFAKAGADWVVFHAESCPKPLPLLRRLRRMGVGAGLALKPRTPASAVLPWLDELDLVLVMTVEPGFGGQSFMERMLPKIRALRSAIDRSGRKVWLQTDGGIGPKTAPLAAGAGSDSLVSGTGVFGAADPLAALRTMRRSAQEAFDRRG